MKFADIDKEYFARRKEFTEKRGNNVFSSTDYWPLYVGHANLARYVAILDILRSTLDTPGHIAEFGMYRGASFMFMAKLMRLFEPMGCKELFGFDSFDGLTTFTKEDKATSDKVGLYAGSYEELMDLVSLHDLQDDVTIFKGLIQDTLPPLLESRTELSFSLVLCDTDLYEPTKLILESMHPRLSKGGIFVLDEWNHEVWKGESIAVREFLEVHGASYELGHPRNTRHPSLIMKKIA